MNGLAPMVILWAFLALGLYWSLTWQPADDLADDETQDEHGTVWAPGQWPKEGEL